MQDVTIANFEDEVLASPVPVVIQFFAKWCEPSYMFTPMLEQLESEIPKAKFVKVETTQRAIVQRYRIGTVPTIMILKKGQIQHISRGTANKETIRKFINNSIGD